MSHVPGVYALLYQVQQGQYTNCHYSTAWADKKMSLYLLLNRS